jgi:hypothetical protein
LPRTSDGSSEPTRYRFAVGLPKIALVQAGGRCKAGRPKEKEKEKEKEVVGTNSECLPKRDSSDIAAVLFYKAKASGYCVYRAIQRSAKVTLTNLEEPRTGRCLLYSYS